MANPYGITLDDAMLPTLLGSLQTLIRARLRVSPRIERRLMPRTCFPNCGLTQCRSSSQFNAPMRWYAST